MQNHTKNKIPSIFTILVSDTVSGNIILFIGLIIIFIITSYSYSTEYIQYSYFILFLMIALLFKRIYKIKKICKSNLIIANIEEKTKYPFGYEIKYSYYFNDKLYNKKFFLKCSIAKKTVLHLSELEIYIDNVHPNNNVIKDIWIYI